MGSLEGFTPADFDAFAQNKWCSHAFNRARLEVKLKLNALGKELVQVLSPKLEGEQSKVTEERPSIFNQHQVKHLTLYFIRSEKERNLLEGILDRSKSVAEMVNDPALHHKHIILGIRLSQQGIEAGLWLHRDAWVDWKNVVQRCREHWDLDRLGELLRALPDSILHVRGGGFFDAPSTPLRQMGTQALLDAFQQEGPWTILGEKRERLDPLCASSDLLPWMSGLLDSLLPLLHFIRWRGENDFHELKDVLKGQKQKAEQRFTSIKVGDEVRVTKGLGSGKIVVVESLERKGVAKVWIGSMLISLKIEDLAAL